MAEPEPVTSRVVGDRFARRLRQVAVTSVLAVFALLAGLWALEELRGLLVLVLLSAFAGFALEPAVDALQRRGVPRGRGTLLVYLGLLLVVVAFAAVLGTIVVQQVTGLVEQLPTYAAGAAAYLERELGLDLSETDVAGSVGTAGQVGRTVAEGALGFGATLLELLLQLLTVATLTFFFAKDGPRLRLAVCSVLPPHRQREVLRAWEIAIDRTAGYVYFRTVLALVSAVAHAVALLLLDVPFAVTLALWVGVVSQFVPAVGIYLAGLLPLGVALAQGPRTALLVLAFITVYQQVENYVLSPPLSARTMSIHPAVGFVAAIAGLALVGPVGALIALPLVATAQAFLSVYLVRHAVVDSDLLPDDE